MAEHDLSQDYAVCAAILADGSKSFYAASKLLPQRMREQASAVYAFCRIADDTMDGGHYAAETFIQVRERLDAMYQDAPLNYAVDKALTQVIKRQAIPRGVWDALLEGLMWDKEGRTYETLEALLEYAVRVASTVGVLMTLLMGERRANILYRACDLGAAMQLTNIARDVGEDAQRGRVYLPQQWLTEAGVRPQQWLAQPTHNLALASTIKRVLDEAEKLYARAFEGIAQLPLRYRLAMESARRVYADIGLVIRKRGYDSINGRAYTSAWRKSFLLTQAAVTAIFFSADAELVDAKANLPQARFLIDCITQYDAQSRSASLL